MPSALSFFLRTALQFMAFYGSMEILGLFALVL